MADGSSTIYGFTLPEVGASSDSWGSKLNQVLQFIDYLLGSHNTAGSSNAYTLTTGFSITGYVTGATLTIKPNFTNTGAATFNLDGLGAKNITKNGTTALVSGDLVSGRIYRISYDGTQWQVLGSLSGEWQPYDAFLAALAALTTADDRMVDLTGSDTCAVVTYATVLANIAAAGLGGTNNYSAADWILAANTSDASDTSQMRICGGGSVATTRGASVIVRGNENATAAGEVLIQAGAGVAGGVTITSGGGSVNVTGATAINGALSASSVTGPAVAGAETTGTMTAGSADDWIIMTGDMTQAASGTFAARQTITLDPGTSNRTFTRGSGMTMYVNGVNSASATIAANTLAVLSYRSGSVSMLSGSGVS